MNRTLKRPMFRRGGSAGTGVTSGLDRPGYKNGTPYEKALTTTERAMQDLERFRGSQPAFAAAGVPGFLTSFGLDLLGRAPSGNIFQTMALSAKGPFEKLQQAQLLNRERKGQRAEDLFSSALASEYGLEEEKLKLAAKGDEGRDPFKFEQEIKILEQRITENNTLNAENARLQEEINSLQAGLNNPNANQAEINSQIQQKQKALDSNNETIGINQTVIQQIKGADEFKLAEAAAILEAYGVDSEEYQEFKKTGKLPRIQSADGGRIGYQMGGTPMMPEVAKAEEEQVQDLSYNELRSRLPQSIGNDVVQVIANSKQALLDFANIRDQQDVDEFNQRYNVNLNISQEG